jgi:uncharacterized membrane protein YdbT with pleckstrin-like domain
MAYPRRLLADGEQVDQELHTHWKALVGPVVALLVIVPVGSYFAARIPSGSSQKPLRLLILVVALVALGWLTVAPFLRWLTTIYVLTDHRLIVRRGIIARSGRDIPLARINDVSFSHTAFERILGCGTLVVESAGERGQLTLTDIPRVERVQRRLYELVEADDSRRRDDDGAEPAHT